MNVDVCCVIRSDTGYFDHDDTRQYRVVRVASPRAEATYVNQTFGYFRQSITLASPLVSHEQAEQGKPTPRTHTYLLSVSQRFRHALVPTRCRCQLGLVRTAMSSILLACDHVPSGRRGRTLKLARSSQKFPKSLITRATCLQASHHRMHHPPTATARQALTSASGCAAQDVHRCAPPVHAICHHVRRWLHVHSNWP